MGHGNEENMGKYGKIWENIGKIWENHLHMLHAKFHGSVFGEEFHFYQAVGLISDSKVSRGKPKKQHETHETECSQV